MSNRVTPMLSKWPFLLGDALLVGFAFVLVLRHPAPIGLGEAAVCVVALAAGAWLCALPFLREYAATVKLGEAEVLATTVAQIGNLDQIKNQIGQATTQWDLIQRQSSQSVAAAKELSDRLAHEREQFCAFLQRTTDAERNHLRLEVEKLRRGERDWLQAVVTILDHIFALHTAGTRSGQPALVTQLNHFHLACRDAGRRLGLIGFAPGPGEPFDQAMHQPEDPAPAANGPGQITEVLAQGFTFRGELVRRALVRVGQNDEPATEFRADGGGSFVGQPENESLDAEPAACAEPAVAERASVDAGSRG